MESVKVGFDWEHPSVEENYGHTQSEWGKSISNDKKKSTIIFSYKIRWKTSK